VPKITAIEPQKNKPHRYSIFVDGEFALGVDEEVIENLGLRPQQALTADKLEQVVAEEQAKQAWRTAVRLLEYRPRSRWELTRRLQQKGFESPTISRTLDRLADTGLVDDERFAQEMVQSLVRSRNLGKRAIFDRLRRAGVSRDVAQAAMDQELADYDEVRQAQQVVDKYLPRLADLEPVKQRRRLQGYLHRRGFPYGVIEQVMPSGRAEY